MGGFVFQISTSTANQISYLEGDRRRLTLTAYGVALLADCGLLPNVPKEDIIDKSKSDGLAKLLACVQAGWMAAQVIERLVLGIEVTLLEINTLGHVFCAFVIYVLWWHKPRLIKEPTALEGDWVAPLCAYMYMSSRLSGRAGDGAGIFKSSPTDAELSSIAFFPRTCSRSHENADRSQDSTTNAKSSTQNGEADALRSQHDLDIHIRPLKSPEDNFLSGSFGPYPAPCNTGEGLRGDVNHTSVCNELANPCTRRSLRWRLAAEALCRYTAIQDRFQPVNTAHTENKALCFQEKHPEELVTEYSGNWSTKGLVPGVGGLVMGIVLWCASMAFGAVHAAAWNNYFPSQTENRIWRYSSS